MGAVFVYANVSNWQPETAAGIMHFDPPAYSQWVRRENFRKRMIWMDVLPET